MDKDIVPELLELIEDEFDAKTYNSDVLKKALQALSDKKATYKDVNDFAIEIGEILADVLGKNITSDILPDGKMYYNIAKRILNPTMSKNHELISGYALDVQTELNHNAGLKIKGQWAELNQNRIDGIIERVSSEDEFDKIKWILDEPIKNFSQSIVDDFVRKNVEFHAKVGLRPKIVRRSTGKCCDWCEEIVGTYEYPDDVPEDVYRRHRYCRCTVDYNPGDGKRQNVHTKEWIDPEKNAKIEARKKIGLQEKTSPKSNIVKNAISSGEVRDEINTDKQLRHLEGQSDGRSYLLGDMDYANELYNKLKGTGTPIMSEKGWSNKERVQSDGILGIHVDKKGKSEETKNAMIVYSKTGSHIYPRGEEK